MDLQGTPIGSTNQGLKNTTDPRARVPVSESAGPVASDSLAAESYNNDEGFAENRNAAPSGASGASSTLNTTDTSAARTLDSASNARERGTEGEGEKYPEGLGGQPSFSGNTNSLGYTGGPSSGSSTGQSGGSTGQSSGSSGHSGESTGQSGGSSGQSSGSTGQSGGTSGQSSGSYGQSGGSAGQSGSSADVSSDSAADNSSSGKTTRSGNTYGGTSTDSTSDGSASGSGSGNKSSNVDTAPNYIADVYLGDTNKPKGKNLTEDDNLEGKTKTDFEIGDNNDPGRAALQNFEKANASGQAGGAQTEIDGANVYDSLKSDDRA